MSLSLCFQLIVVLPLKLAGRPIEAAWVEVPKRLRHSLLYYVIYYRACFYAISMLMHLLHFDL
jgi:hypothetical protein